MPSGIYKRKPFTEEHKKNIGGGIKKLWQNEEYKNQIRKKLSKENHWNWQGGKPKCIDCEKELSNYNNKRCKKCEDKRNKGKGSPCWKESAHPRCIDCGKQLSIRYSIRCKSCEGKNRFKDPEYKIKHIQRILKKLHSRPNKPEKMLGRLLSKSLPNQYRYVGGGQVIVESFNPDFVNIKQKKIVELFGCYWHKCKQCGFGSKKILPKDVGRLKTYKKYGYKTLIVWEHELKDLNKIKSKIGEFNER